ncbi:CDP-diacylglycerol--glycerol-3-phosphate 3-phosphatidyltransferase [Mycoplasma suis]
MVLLQVNRNSIPNLLTISRFILGFLSVLFYAISICTELNGGQETSLLFSKPLFTLGFITLIVSLVTDYFDGHLARKWNCTSNFGKLYDPLADKLIVSAFLILFASKSFMHWIIPFFSIMREIIIERVRYKLKKIYVILQASNTAKYKTSIQFIAVILTYLFFSYKSEWGNILFLPSLLFSFHSLAKYLQIYWKYY